MIAAQQQQIPFHNGSAHDADDQEQFLRTLFSTPMDASPPSSLSAATSSYVASPPADSTSSSDATTSIGYHSLHDFLHDEPGSTSWPPISQQESFVNMDMQAHDFFVKSMNTSSTSHQNQNFVNDLSMPTYSFGTSIVPPDFQFQSNTTPYSVDMHHALVSPQNVDANTRKRSSPAEVSVDSSASNDDQQITQEPLDRHPKKLRSKLYTGLEENNPLLHSTDVPHMEVGSNATALAAIERLKATRRAAEAQVQHIPKDERKAPSMATEQRTNSATPKHEKKVAHNAIERRYRNNINARITALRNVVPALQELRPKRPRRKGKEILPEDFVDGVPAATKLNKATILGKATEYIRYLKGRETRLAYEVVGLRGLIRSLEGGDELLDLWQGEMDRLILTQTSTTSEEDMMKEDEWGKEEDGEDDGDDYDDDDLKPSRSPSNVSASGRSLMGIFMGMSLLEGSFDPLSKDHSSQSTSQSSQRSGGRVLGASHQLLKRGMSVTNVRIGSVAHTPHHLDHAPAHHLLIEAIRGVIILACLVFIFWPILAKIFTRKSQEHKAKKEGRERDTTRILNAALADPKVSSSDIDSLLRKHLGAPLSSISAFQSLLWWAVSELAAKLKLARRSKVSQEKAISWTILLELETSLGPWAQRSFLARLHTIVFVSTLPNVGVEVRTPTSPSLDSARIFGTLAIALARITSHTMLAERFVEHFWTMARRSMLVNTNIQNTSSESKWLDLVLGLSYGESIALCPSTSHVATDLSTSDISSERRQAMFSPLLNIATTHHTNDLISIWSTILHYIVMATCPTGGDTALDTIYTSFMDHRNQAHVALPANTEERTHLSQKLSRLALTVPRNTQLHMLTNVTFGTWSLMLGNIAVARGMAKAIVEKSSENQMPTSSVIFVQLVLGYKIPNTLHKDVGEMDALAVAVLMWMILLRSLSTESSSYIAETSLTIRRCLALSRAARPSFDDVLGGLQANMMSSDDASSSTSISSSSAIMSEDILEDSIDTLTDVLTAVGRRAAYYSTTGHKLGVKAEDDADSGVFDIE